MKPTKQLIRTTGWHYVFVGDKIDIYGQTFVVTRIVDHFTIEFRPQTWLEWLRGKLRL